MAIKLLTEHYLEFLSLKGGCTGSSERKCHIVGNHMFGSIEFIKGANNLNILTGFKNYLPIISFKRPLNLSFLCFDDVIISGFFGQHLSFNCTCTTKFDNVIAP